MMTVARSVFLCAMTSLCGDRPTTSVNKLLFITLPKKHKGKKKKKIKKKPKRVGIIPPSAGHGSHVVGEVALLLPLGMAAPPAVEYFKLTISGDKQPDTSRAARALLPASHHPQVNVFPVVENKTVRNHQELCEECFLGFCVTLVCFFFVLVIDLNIVLSSPSLFLCSFQLVVFTAAEALEKWTHEWSHPWRRALGCCGAYQPNHQG